MTRTTAHRDQGFALETVLMAVLLLSLLGIAGYTISQQSILDSTRTLHQTTAFQAASSGLERAISVFTTATVGQPLNGTIGDGSYTVTVTQAAGNRFAARYLFTSVGTAGGQTSTVKQYLNFTLLDLWAVQVSGDPEQAKRAFGSAGEFNAKDALLQGPLYVAGDVSMNSNATIQGGPWFVTGSLVHFGNGIRWGGTSQILYTNLSSPAARVGTGWNWTTVDYPCPAIEIPFLDQEFVDGAYVRARTESSDNLVGDTQTTSNEVPFTGNPSSYPSSLRFPGTPSSCYKVISTSDTATAPRLWNLTDPRTSYTIGPNPFGRTTDDLALVGGVLYVRGTVFVDGNLTINSAVTSYQGYGSLIVNGDVTLSGSGPLQPTGSNPDVATNLSLLNNVGIVAVGDISTDRNPVEGTLFSNHTVNIGKDGRVYGTIHGGAIIGGVKTRIIVEAQVDSENVPPSMPGGSRDPRPSKQGRPSSLGVWTRQ